MGFRVCWSMYPDGIYFGPKVSIYIGTTLKPIYVLYEHMTLIPGKPCSNP